MKIFFVSTARYPTEKAYGVTIGESCAAANRLGHIANVVTIGPSGVDTLGNQVVGFESGLLRKLRSFIQSGSSSYLTRIAFALSSILFAQKLRSSFIDDSPGILWARDIFLVFALKAINYQGMILLEIHH